VRNDESAATPRAAAPPTPEAANAAVMNQPLYVAAAKIYPRAVHGWFAAWRWALVWATQLVFYGGPWLRWNDRQALLFDIAQRKFYIFGLVFWPQDVIYLTLLLVISALSLFLFTAVAGRLWCGYACPQTVYTEIFMWIERVIEGDRNQRIRLDRGELGAKKLALKGAKHAVWIALALWTGFTFVGYFTPIRALGGDVLNLLGLNAGAPAPALGPWATFWILFYGFATYGNAGWMREQVCKYMCPYARFQSAMFDRDTLIITYDGARGEPRGGRARGRDKGALGDCVDCGICVQVCPTGIDIREGLQYECIGCAACIDGCDQVMDKMGYPRGLIRYSTQHALDNKLGPRAMWRRVFRPRILVYSAVLWAIIFAGAFALYARVPLKVDIIRDRAAIAREVAGGLIENVYRVQLMNTQETARRFRLSAEGLPSLTLVGDPVVEVDGASARLATLKLRVAPAQVPAGKHPITIDVQAVDDAAIAVREKSIFIVR